MMRDHKFSQIVGRPFRIEEPSGAGCLIIQNALQFREQLSIVVQLLDQRPSQTTTVWHSKSTKPHHAEHASRDPARNVTPTAQAFLSHHWNTHAKRKIDPCVTCTWPKGQTDVDLVPHPLTVVLHRQMAPPLHPAVEVVLVQTTSLSKGLHIPQSCRNLRQRRPIKIEYSAGQVDKKRQQ
jgi:hypothetical protein